MPLRSLGLILALCALARVVPADDVPLRRTIEAFKKDPRGPYQAIRWFCPNGSILPARQRCSEPGGLQHAQLKPRVERLRREQHLFLGQILAGTPHAEFFDEGEGSSRAKQYQLEHFLQAVDDGWIQRRSRYYRGAVQAEDENAWGEDFLLWLLERDDLLEEQFYLLRQLTRDLPHGENPDRGQAIRGLARDIADGLPAFMDLRVKIHSQPDANDGAAVAAFRRDRAAKLTPEQVSKLEALEIQIGEAYRQATLERLCQRLAELGDASRDRLEGILAPSSRSAGARCQALARLLWEVRLQLPAVDEPSQRLKLLDLSLETESLLFRSIGAWEPMDLRELLLESRTLALACAGAGFIEVWEWRRLEPRLALPTGEGLVLGQLLEIINSSLSAVEWASAMVEAVYGDVSGRFAAFEPLAHGFVDDRIRSSILLPFGQVAARLTSLANRHSARPASTLGLGSGGHLRGLNPGVALGELVVITGTSEPIDFAPDKVYVLRRAPADLKPVAGIATVSEGNAVSHVQLLARNLGIPNAVLSAEVLDELAPHGGSRVFYAVTPGGAVILKPAGEMNDEERALVKTRAREPTRVIVPTDELELQQTAIIGLDQLRSHDSGRVCGPKAANLGQLASLFPGHVPAGIVIPFGVFHEHLRQHTPADSQQTYWDLVREVFAERGRDQKHRLDELRSAIGEIPFLPGFERELRSRFSEGLGHELGELRVFVRSDTNMEDLHDFTGAGLNLTVGNIRRPELVLQAILDVWASPFTERSYRWRQAILDNPEAVFPSVLILPSVSVDKSGVLITTGLISGKPLDSTVAFNWGGAGAVEGQAAEAYELRHRGRNLLLKPAREPIYHQLLETGGMGERRVHFDVPVLSARELDQLREMADTVRNRLPEALGPGPFDVELGFSQGRLWLFQVRPFVENKRARSYAYLNELDRQVPLSHRIPLNEPLRGRD